MRWFVEISAAGQGATSAVTVCVEAPQWQPALQKVRAMRGEDGPAHNLSIELLDEGFRAVDRSTKRRYTVRRAPEDAPLTDDRAPASKPAPEPASTPAPASTSAAAPASTPAPAPTERPKSVRPKPIEIPPDPVPKAKAEAPLPAFEVVSAREEQPSQRQPLSYREIAYAVKPGTPEEDARRLALDRFENVRDEMSQAPAGKLINLAVFDHVFSGKPQRRPVVTLTWKDWKSDAVEIRFPGRETPSSPESVPVPPTAISRPKRIEPEPASTPPAVHEKPASPPPAPAPPSPAGPTLNSADAEPPKVIAPAPAVAVIEVRTPAPAIEEPKPAIKVEEPKPAIKVEEPKPEPAAVPPTHVAPTIVSPAVASNDPIPSTEPAELPPLPSLDELKQGPVSKTIPSRPSSEVEKTKETEPLAPAKAKSEPPPAPAKAKSEPPPAPAKAKSEPPPAPAKAKSEPPPPAPAKAKSEPPPAPAKAKSEPPPKQQEVPPTLAKPAPAAPPAPEFKAPPPAPAPPKPTKKRARGDDLLVELFEACADLHFLNDAVEGADFVLALLSDKIPSELTMVSFFDINKREFLVVRQAGGKGSAIGKRQPEKSKLAHEAMRSKHAIVVAGSAANDDRVQATGVAPKTFAVAPVALGGRYLGLIEIANPLDGGSFDASDGNALTYIGQQLGELIASRGVVLDPEIIFHVPAAAPAAPAPMKQAQPSKPGGKPPAKKGR